MVEENIMKENAGWRTPEEPPAEAQEDVTVVDANVIDTRPEEPLADAPEDIPVESEKVEDAPNDVPVDSDEKVVDLLPKKKR